MNITKLKIYILSLKTPMKYYERLLYLKNILIYLILFIKFPYFDFN